MSTMIVEIVSAQREEFSGEAEMLFAPARLGEVGIAPGHAALLTDLRPGNVRVQQPGGEQYEIYVTGGVLEVQPYKVTLLADHSLRGEELDENAALEARKAAEEAMKGASKEDLEKAREQLVEAAARYRAAQKLRGVR